MNMPRLCHLGGEGFGKNGRKINEKAFIYLISAHSYLLVCLPSFVLRAAVSVCRGYTE